jgi:hypothetical protein
MEDPNQGSVRLKQSSRDCRADKPGAGLTLEAGSQMYPVLNGRTYTNSIHAPRQRPPRETELAETWPEHVVCAWIGTTVAVARKHYLQVTDEHFEQAVLKTTPAGGDKPKQAAQRPDALPGNESHPATEPPFCDSLQVLAGQCVTNMGHKGPEQPTCGAHDNDSKGNELQHSTTLEDSHTAARSAADVARLIDSDSDMATVLKVWPVLSESAKARILAIVGGQTDEQVRQARGSGECPRSTTTGRTS